MFKATKEIYEAMIEAGLKCMVDEVDDCSMVKVQFPLAYSAPINVYFMSIDDDNDVAVRVDLMRVEAGDGETILAVLNDLNLEYRYVKFTLNGENDVFVAYDMPINGDNVGECAKEILARFQRIIHQVHPKLLHAVFTMKAQAEASEVLS